MPNFMALRLLPPPFNSVSLINGMSSFTAGTRIDDILLFSCCFSRLSWRIRFPCFIFRILKQSLLPSRLSREGLSLWFSRGFIFDISAFLYGLFIDTTLLHAPILYFPPPLFHAFWGFALRWTGLRPGDISLIFTREHTASCESSIIISGFDIYDILGELFLMDALLVLDNFPAMHLASIFYLHTSLSHASQAAALIPSSGQKHSRPAIAFILTIISSMGIIYSSSKMPLLRSIIYSNQNFYDYDSLQLSYTPSRQPLISFDYIKISVKAGYALRHSLAFCLDCYFYFTNKFSSFSRQIPMPFDFIYSRFRDNTFRCRVFIIFSRLDAYIDFLYWFHFASLFRKSMPRQFHAFSSNYHDVFPFTQTAVSQAHSHWKIFWLITVTFIFPLLYTMTFI